MNERQIDQITGKVVRQLKAARQKAVEQAKFYPRTIGTETPTPPAWVRRAGREAIWAWNHSLSWRGDAASAKTTQYQRTLIKEARLLFSRG